MSKKCKWCGKELDPENDMPFCSDQCYQEWRCEYDANKHKEKRVCPECGISFISSHHRQKYCSKECSKAAQSKLTKKWIKEHSTELKEYRKKYYKSHRDHYLAYNHKYYIENSEKYKKRAADRYREKKDCIKRYRKEMQPIRRANSCCKRHHGIDNCPYDECIQLGKNGNKVCPVCGGEVVNPSHIYCSDECRLVGKRKAQERFYRKKCLKNDKP